MSTADLACLTDLDPSEAWRADCDEFVEWLAEHARVVGDLIGVRLEAEVPRRLSGRDSADLVMRDVRNGERLLVECQYGESTNERLGKIVTYLTATQAQKVLWIAGGFRDEHLSAISWLNEHARHPSGFYALRLRVVRIEDSPPAPIFEVLAKPNEWDRRIRHALKASADASPQDGLRLEFWARFAERHPDCAHESGGGTASRLLPVPEVGLAVARWFSRSGVGVFVTGPAGMSTAELEAVLLPHKNEIESRLGWRMGDPQHAFEARHPFDAEDRSRWDAMIDLVYDEANRFAHVLRAVIGAGA
jgi:hypothetical protein